MAYKDKEKKREYDKKYNREYHRKNREERLKYKKEHRQKIKASWKGKDPYEENEKKGITEKACTQCSHISGREKLPIRAFVISTSELNGINSECKDCESYRKSKYRKGRHTLTREYFIELRHKPCTYCNREATIIESNSVDRIDSSKDYTKNNVQPCCGVCNLMKNDHSHEFFIEHSKRMLEHLGYIVVEKGQQTLFGD
tara:strand:+ start:18 stop:614 length:597 start_codon:yes stop_codon:yes gene_type:complete